jgi:hypothetical protein
MNLNRVNFAFNPVLLTNITFALFPISFIFGNFIVNIVFVLFCCLGVYHLRSKIITNKFDFNLKIIFILFLLILFSTCLNFVQALYYEDYQDSDLSKLLKSILFFRFFIILLIVYLISDLDIINYKFFFISSAILPILISIDVIFQYIFGFNIVGIEGLSRHNSSFFGDELISGGYIQNFSFFSILFLAYIIRKKNNFYNIILNTLVICTLAMGIFLSGNRIPFFLFLIGLFFLFFFCISLRKILLISFFIIALIFGKVTSSNVNMNSHYGIFYYDIKDAAVNLPKKIKNNILSTIKGNEEFKNEKWEDDPKITDREEHSYKKLALTAFEVWKKNKLFGNGIKSFRYECHTIIEEQRGRLLLTTPQGLCSNHPHNYYLEILVDLGIVGLLLIILIALRFMAFLVKNYKVLKNENNLQNLFLLAVTINLFLEGFPLKSTGSIFTTNNATYIILMSSIILSYKKLLAGKNFK